MRAVAARPVAHDASTIRGFDAGQDPQERALAAAVLADDRHELPGARVEARAEEHALASVALVHVLYAEGRLLHLVSRACRPRLCQARCLLCHSHFQRHGGHGELPSFEVVPRLRHRRGRRHRRVRGDARLGSADASLCRHADATGWRRGALGIDAARRRGAGAERRGSAAAAEISSGDRSDCASRGAGRRSRRPWARSFSSRREARWSGPATSRERAFA